jgi:hypothetical protein
MKKRDMKAKIKEIKEIGDEILKLVRAALDGKPITKKMMKTVEELKDKLKKNKKK